MIFPIEMEKALVYGTNSTSTDRIHAERDNFTRTHRNESTKIE